MLMDGLHHQVYPITPNPRTITRHYLFKPFPDLIRLLKHFIFQWSFWQNMTQRILKLFRLTSSNDDCIALSAIKLTMVQYLADI